MVELHQRHTAKTADKIKSGGASASAQLGSCNEDYHLNKSKIPVPQVVACLQPDSFQQIGDGNAKLADEADKEDK